jgi:hypothetical protein
MLKTIKHTNILTFCLYFWQSVVLNSANDMYKLNVNISFNSSWIERVNSREGKGPLVTVPMHSTLKMLIESEDKALGIFKLSIIRTAIAVLWWLYIWGKNVLISHWLWNCMGSGNTEKQTPPLPVKSMGQTPWQVSRCPADQEISKLLWKTQFIIVFTKFHYLTLPWANKSNTHPDIQFHIQDSNILPCQYSD